MAKIKRGLFAMAAIGLCLFQSLALAAEESGKKNQKYVASELNFSDLLFPNSASWKSFESLEKPTLKKQSWKNLAAEMLGKDADYCRLDDTRIEEAKPHFRILPVPQTGEVVLIYSGPALCREGDQTFIWRHYFDSSGAVWTAAIPWAHKILRVKTDGEPRFIGVGYGCCADPYNAYYRADLFNPDGVETIRSSSFLEIPPDAIHLRRWRPLDESADDRGGFNLGGVLRFSPEVNDEKNSEDDYAPTYGNIARRLPSFVALQLLAYTEPSGKKWALVRVFDPSSIEADGYGDVDIGWVQEPEYRDAK